jgi:hypothetical protein
MRLFIAGEDEATKAIIKRVLGHCSSNFEIISELPARGGQIKSKMKEFNNLAEKNPVILLTDLDSNNCAPELKAKLIDFEQHKDFIFNIAVDEAEAWLMADRLGFAKYFGLDTNEIPLSVKKKQGGRKELMEMDFSYKSSMFLTHELIKKSKKKDFVVQLSPKKGAAKGPEYNSAILPFIINEWDIELASQNSDSLSRMIKRLHDLINE